MPYSPIQQPVGSEVYRIVLQQKEGSGIPVSVSASIYITLNDGAQGQEAVVDEAFQRLVDELQNLTDFSVPVGLKEMRAANLTVTPTPPEEPEV